MNIRHIQWRIRGGACLYLNNVAVQRHILQLNYQKVEVCVVNLFAAIFGDQRIEGFREKGK